MPEINEETETEHAPEQDGQEQAEQVAGGEDAAAAGEENAAAAAETAEAPRTPEQRIAELESQLAAEHDLYLRKAADFENYRKRSVKDKQEAIDFANQSLLLDLIPILDDFERALKVAAASQKTEADFTTLLDGIGMVEKRLSSQLENKWQLQRFDSAGEPFDPDKHEALMMEKSAELTEATVQEDFVKGYMLKGRVIRPAKVKVLMPE